MDIDRETMTSERLKALRERAERILAEKNIDRRNALAQEFDEILHELQVYQVELEMQNDELMSALEEGERQKHLFSSLFESAPVAYISVAKNGLIININKTGLQLFDKAKNMMVDKPLAAFVSSPDLHSFYRFLRDTAEAKYPQTAQLQFLKTGDQIFTGLLQGAFVESEGIGQQLYITIADVSEKKANELAREKAKLRLELALEASSAGICELNPATGEFKLDRHASQYLGFGDDDFYGEYEQLVQNIVPEDRALLKKELEMALFREASMSLEFRVHTPSGGLRYIQARGQLVYEEETKSTLLATFTDITDKKLLEEQAQRLKDEQDKAMLQAGLFAEEKEKQRMSEALHNGVAQMLYATRINLDHLRAKAPQLPFSKVVELIDQTIKDVRNLSFELTPTVLSEFGLKAAIDEMIHRVETEELTLKSEIKIQGLTSDTQLSIYRITQELVNNAVKHASCKEIRIKINKNKDRVQILVTDDGEGIVNPGNSKRGGTGLSSIRNRLRLYDGKIEIKPNTPTGTQVFVELNTI